MRIAPKVAGALCLFVGCIWPLQEIHVLPGSLLTDRMKWAVNGELLFVVGLGLFVGGRRTRMRIHANRA